MRILGRERGSGRSYLTARNQLRTLNQVARCETLPPWTLCLALSPSCSCWSRAGLTDSSRRSSTTCSRRTGSARPARSSTAAPHRRPASPPGRERQRSRPTPPSGCVRDVTPDTILRANGNSSPRNTTVPTRDAPVARLPSQTSLRLWYEWRTRIRLGATRASAGR